MTKMENKHGKWMYQKCERELEFQTHVIQYI